MDYGRLRERLEDVMFSTTTPFAQDPSIVLYDALAANLSYLYEAGGRVFLACGSTGEYHALTDEERVEIVRTHADAKGDDATVLGRLGGSGKGAIRSASAYESAGANGSSSCHHRSPLATKRVWSGTIGRSPRRRTLAS